MDNVQPLLSALDVFTRAPDKTSLENANAWLQEFQHSVNPGLLVRPTSDSNLARRLVDLQPPSPLTRCTTRSKALCSPDIQVKGMSHAPISTSALTCVLQVTYDLHQVDATNLLALRDTLITALERYHTGPRTVITQLCLAVSGLALQLPQWDNAVQTMIDSFGRNPATVPVLLQFLTVLPEELVTNTRIPITVGQLHIMCLQLTLIRLQGR